MKKVLSPKWIKAIAGIRFEGKKSVMGQWVEKHALVLGSR